MPRTLDRPYRALPQFAPFMIALVFALLAAALGAATSASAAAQQHDAIVSDNPRNWTPDVLDGRVLSIVEVGDRVVVGGEFSQVREKGEGKPILSRTNVFAFDPTDGTVDPDFAPLVDGEVQVVLPAPDGESVFLGGAFSNVNGYKTRKLARLQVADGAIFPGFKVSPLDGLVSDLRLVGDQLVLAGFFLTVGGVPRQLLASVDPDTGSRTDFIDFTFSQPRKGVMSVSKLDVTPDGDRLVAIGNFGQVDGQSRPQLAVFDTSGPVATLDGWRSGFFRLDRCSSSFWTYMRDLDIDPTGTFFVVSTTGAYGGAESPCDVIARFELDSTHSDVVPTWRNYTGGDTTYAVEITDVATYVGGHMRWLNNPFRGDREGPGAVPREGIAALDSRSGMPYSWNPGRDRGVGVFDLLATDLGLFVGSDTDLIAWEEHRKLALMPLGDSPLPAEKTGELPNDVYLLGAGEGGGAVTRHFLAESGGPQNSAVIDDGTAWDEARGSFLIDDQLYAGWADGTMTRRTFNGATFGPEVQLELYNGTVANDLGHITGMFFDPVAARIYYTLDGQNTLVWRGFNPESDIIGPISYPATGDVPQLNPVQVSGMFVSGQTLYFVDKDSGVLYSVGFVDGSVVGPRQLVDDSIDWRSRGAFVWNGAPAPLPNVDPLAHVVSDCVGLACTFSAAGSVDPDGGQIVSYEWDFAGVGSGSGAESAYVFASDGDYPVSLTVTDDRGGVDTAELVVWVANVAPSASFTQDCAFLQCSFTSTSQDPGGSLVSFAWDFGDGVVSDERDPVHAFGAGGEYEVTLTVTDDQGVADVASMVVTAVDLPASAIDYRDAATFSGNVTSAQVAVPSSVEAGDALLLFVSTNTGDAPSSVPAGWGLVGERTDQNLLSQLYVQVATGASAGSEVAVELPGTAKTDLTLLAYSGTDAVAPIAAWAVADEPDLTAEHATPGIEVTGGNSWLVNYWVDKSSATEAWTVPGDATVRSTVIGFGGGRLTSVAVDYGATAPAGQWPAKVATASSASARAVMWTITLESA